MKAQNTQDKTLELLTVEGYEQLSYEEQLEKFNQHRVIKYDMTPEMPPDFLKR